MIKRFPSRNQRPQSIKVKHILQICLLVGVCFWLAYQVKRSHDKKRELEESDVNSVGDQILKLGRKDLDPRVVGIVKNGKNEEEEEDELVAEDEENKHEGEREEEDKHEEEQDEENKREEKGDRENRDEGDEHEAEDQDEEENRSDETEDERKAGGDEEIDEMDLEKPEAEMQQDEKFLDEEREKEREERENEKEGDDKENQVENQNMREAREENYRADDASSAVAHEAQAAEKESGKVEHSSEDDKGIIQGDDTEKNSSEDGTGDNSSTGIGSRIAVSVSSLKETSGLEIGNTSLPNSLKPSNTDLEGNSAGAGIDPTAGVAHGASEDDGLSNRTAGSGRDLSTAEANIGSSDSLPQNGTEKLSESDFVQNSTTNESDHGASEAMRLQKLFGESDSNSSSVATSNAENNAAMGESWRNAETKEKNISSETDTDGNIRSGDPSSNSGAAQHDPIDASDVAVRRQAAEARAAVGTLPDIRTRADVRGEAASE